MRVRSHRNHMRMEKPKEESTEEFNKKQDSRREILLRCQEQEVRWIKRQRELLVVITLTPGSEYSQLLSELLGLSYWPEQMVTTL